MANLIYKETDWTIVKDLMFVSFEHEGKELKWFPKWKDLRDIFTRAYYTEQGRNKGKLVQMFELVALRVLIDNLNEKLKIPPEKSREKFMEIMGLFDELEMILDGEDIA